MIRRRTLDILTVAAVVCTLGAVTYHVLATGEDRQTRERQVVGDKKTAPGADGHAGHGAHFDACAKECATCQLACSSCANHCARLNADGKKEHFKTLQTCLDCADHCAAAAQIVSRGGPFSDLICKACAEACARCGKACELQQQDAHMKACADECRRCEKACRTMVEHASHSGAQ